jgi:hypothetical protein
MMIGQHDVQDDQVRRPLGDLLQRHLAVGGAGAFVAGARQVAEHDVGE